MQEFYALLMAHAAIRGLMSEAAIRTDQASEDLSFVHTLNVLRRRLPAQAGLPPEPLSPLSNAKSGSTACWPRSPPIRV